MLHVITRDEEALAEIYMVAEGADLHAIAVKGESILETLKAAREKIREIFGDVGVRLGLETDPEIRTWEQVVVDILIPSTMIDAAARLERFDRDWWLAASTLETVAICFSLRPI